MSALRPTEQRVIAVLRRHHRLSRAELAEITGLPRATVVSTVTSLLRRGLLLEHAEPNQRPRPVGRPGTVLSLAHPDGVIGVVTFAHSSTALALCRYDGTVVARRALEIVRTASLDAVVAAVRSGLDQLAEASDAGPISVAVVGVPLPFQPGRGTRHPRPLTGELLSTFPTLHPFPAWLLGDPSAVLADSLGVPAIAENDANLGALGEARYGAGRGRRAVIYVAVHDGVGAGLVLDGTLYRGATGIAGELGHVSVHDNGRLCVCGNRGCLITMHKHGPLLTGEIEAAYGHPVTAADLQSLTTEGDVGVLRLLTDMGRAIGRPLADLAAVLNPDAIVVDATLGSATQPVVDGVRETIARRTPPMINEAITVLPGQLGDSAQLLGAVALAREAHVDRLLAPRPRAARQAHGR